MIFTLLLLNQKYPNPFLYKVIYSLIRMSCEECLKKDKKIKIIQSDYDFQLRKTIEDKAEQKALYEISVQKEIRKWQDKYQKQKLDHDQNSKKWLNKIDEQTSKCEKQICLN